eukprot:CAMPEP_0115836510 /NCGR_PEP_ID=MMETSP0287-20121206/4743_1 /TAXON_ID=412157 /ORGANISM="Chrysochromulina rotalis, Strain UIO044" /LENGTH=214 /DNA_ID=CAMNT_0003289993 /DNA_START=79 /DNA_END=723 /DNA_ORIENTATION=+
MSFSQDKQIEVVLNKLKAHLSADSGSLKRAFQKLDKDRSNSLSGDEFKEILKEMNVVLPPSVFSALLGKFDLNGDGQVSIPEFMAFMSEDSDRMETLRSAPALAMAEATQSQQSVYGMPQSPRTMTPRGSAMYGSTEAKFMMRMENDTESRRRTAFINELRKDSRFHESMLEPPKSKLQEVTLKAGPIIKTHNSKKTGLEGPRPFQWGTLGGYY